MPPPRIKHRFLTGHYLLAITGALMWIVSAWLPIGYYPSGRPINLFDDYSFEGMLDPLFGAGVIASAHYMIAAGVITLALIAFSLRNAVVWAAVLWVGGGQAVALNEYSIPVEGGYGFGIMTLSVITLIAASIWERIKEGKSRVSDTQKEAAEQ